MPIWMAMSAEQAVMNVPNDPAERRGWIVWQLRLRGSSLAAIARRLGVVPQSVHGALNAPSERIEVAIAEDLGLPVQKVFPERFAPDGRRLCQSRPWNRNTGREAAERQFGRSA
jgi:lambda repressor-like predicted transcriptional regulator